MRYLVDLKSRKTPAAIGNKAYNLRRLSKMGMRIPKTYVVSWNAYRRYLQDDTELVEELSLELSQFLNPDTTYAIRSSANIEDSMDRSFAGTI